MCSAVPPALSCPPASWVWRAAARIRGGGGGVAGREGRGRGGKGGREDGAERRGGAAAAGSPDCVSSPTRMSSSGEEDQAVHGSSAPPAAAAQTVAVPHTGLGNCRLRGAQCACAAPAVAVPPVLMLKLLLRLQPRWPSPGRGLSMSPPAPRPGAGEREEPTRAPLFPSLLARPRPLYCAFLSPGPSPPASRSWIKAAPPSPTSAGCAPRVHSSLPGDRGKTRRPGAAEWERKWEKQQEPEWAMGSRKDDSSASPAGSRAPKASAGLEMLRLLRG